MGCHFLLQRTFPTQELKLCLLHWQADSLTLAPPGKPRFRNYFAVLQECTQHCKSTIFQKVSSVAQLCLILRDPMDCSTPGLPVHHQLPELAQTHVHWVGDAIQTSHLLSSPSPPAFNLSQRQGLFQWVGSSASVLRMDWFDLLAVQGTLKSPLQYHSSKSSTLQRAAFFVVQFSQPLTSFNFHNRPSHALESPNCIDTLMMPPLWKKEENVSERSPKSPRVI